MREFPLDNLAAAASMLARCAGGEKTFPLISVLFAQAGGVGLRARATRVPELFKFAKQAGFTQESFDKCLTDQKLLDDITAVRTRGYRDVRRELDADLLHQRQEAGGRDRSRTSTRPSRRS